MYLISSEKFGNICDMSFIDIPYHTVLNMSTQCSSQSNFLITLGGYHALNIKR